MALKICLTLDEQFKVGKTVIKVVEIKGLDCTLEIRGALIQRFRIDTRGSEILPNVKINTEKTDRQLAGPHKVWLAITAPKDVRIERMQYDAERFGQTTI